MSGKRQKKVKHPLRRLLFAALLLAALAVFFRWSNHSLQVEQFTFADARLPSAFEGSVLLQLTDLHGAEFGEGNEDLLAAVRAQAPDAILLTGDLYDEDTEDPLGYAATLCAGLTAIAPTYYVTGNHEWAAGQVPECKALLTSLGVTVLSNEWSVWEKGGQQLILAGIDDPNGYADQKTPEQLASDLHAALGDPCWLLLAHRNDHFAGQYSLLGADLTLSGHGHGGCIRLPFTDGLFGTQRDLFPSYTAGFYTVGGAELFVSRGLGNVGRTFRLFNRPQAAVIRLTAQQ